MKIGEAKSKLTTRDTAFGRLRRRGNAMVYTIIVLPAMFAVTSLAVDLGRAQLIKSELQRAADSAARGYLAIRLQYGDAAAQTYGPQLPGLSPVDPASGVAATATVTRGSWNAQTRTFTPGSGSPFAVRVTMSRTQANNNAVSLPWATLIGRPRVDIDATAIAVLTSPTAQTFNVSAQSDPWLAGMPNGSTASYNDVAPAQSPRQLTIPVVPGTYISFSNINGNASHGPTLAPYDPDGKPAIYSHGADSPGGPTPAAENGIGDVRMPINAFQGVFLDDNQPNLTPAPTDVRDYTTAESRSQEFYSDIQKKQPFFIGDGKTGWGTGATQKFLVPPGATRLFVGIMDGHEWSNNVGSFNVTASVVETIQLVQ
jgi:Flp pilus assembly protein TadG